LLFGSLVSGHGQSECPQSSIILPDDKSWTAAPILPALAQSYRRKYADVELQLYKMNPDEQPVAFDDGRIQLGFSRPLPPERKAKGRSIGKFGRRIVRAISSAWRAGTV
jgi:hypothetical protein